MICRGSCSIEQIAHAYMEAKQMTNSHLILVGARSQLDYSANLEADVSTVAYERRYSAPLGSRANRKLTLCWEAS